MARRRSRNRLVVPNASQGVDRFKAEVMKRQGYAVNTNRPEDVKYEVARSIGIPLNADGNGQLTTEQAGKIGGQIGGTMVREMIRMAQQTLLEKQRK